jgi:hypothetical protein
VRYEPPSLAFSTADIEALRIHLEDGRPRVEYRKWQEKPVVLPFQDVVAILWDDGDAALSSACSRGIMTGMCL